MAWGGKAVAKRKITRLPNALIETVPHREQRYDTAGDWYKASDSQWRIRISKMKHSHAEFLCAMHELTEWYLCQARGITQAQVDRFDLNYSGKYADDPGCDPEAPYHKEHMTGLKIEKLLAKALGVIWKRYNDQYGMLKWREPEQSAPSRRSRVFPPRKVFRRSGRRLGSHDSHVATRGAPEPPPFAGR